MTSASPPSETTRIEAFSDGVFAIAITLLILDIRVPKVDAVQSVALAAGGDQGAALVSRLLHLWPHLLAYLLSFGVILVLWVNHHRVFTLVRKSDQTFLYLNGLVLMLVTFIPFPTSLLSEYMQHGEPGMFRVAVVVYAGHGLLIAITFNLMWRYAIAGGRLLPAGYDKAEISRIQEQYRWGPAAYLVAFLLSFVMPWASLGLCLALVVLFSAQGILMRKSRRA